MKEKNFERELPANYEQIFHINAKSAKVGIIFNLIAGVIMLFVIAVAAVVAVVFENYPGEFSFILIELTLVAVLVIMIVYMVLHELLHGAAYKIMTGEKLKFGMSWSCAFCGVPGIYTYRKTALIALLTPFVVFSAILVPLTVVAFFVSFYFYFAMVFVLASHLGGCVGDVYVAILFLSKFKDKRILMRDTGPEQFFYLCCEKEIDNA